jgi:purine-binding chemotaxis protein CheW
MAESRELRTLLFRLGSAVYGCDIGTVREIVPFRPATRLPGTPPYVNGLVNVRGTIITVVDLAARLGAGGPATADGSIIIAEVGARRLGMAVADVMDVAVLQVDRAPDERGDAVVFGLGHLAGTVVIVLDVAALVAQVLL